MSNDLKKQTKPVIVRSQNIEQDRGLGYDKCGTVLFITWPFPNPVFLISNLGVLTGSFPHAFGCCKWSLAENSASISYQQCFRDPPKMIAAGESVR